MRIVGIVLILIGLPLIGWFGYVELYYLGEVESGSEEQKIKSEEAIISKIKETKDKFNTMKANLKKSKASKKKIAQVDAQFNDLMGGLKENYKKQEKAFAKIIEIKNSERRNAVCDLCKDKNKNKPILGLNILNGLERDGEEWSGGTILDPRNGNVYKCYIQLVQKDKLKIRGYLGLALFGKTAYWQRAK